MRRRLRPVQIWKTTYRSEKRVLWSAGSASMETEEYDVPIVALTAQTAAAPVAACNWLIGFEIAAGPPLCMSESQIAFGVSRVGLLAT